MLESPPVRYRRFRRQSQSQSQSLNGWLELRERYPIPVEPSHKDETQRAGAPVGADGERNFLGLEPKWCGLIEADLPPFRSAVLVHLQLVETMVHVAKNDLATLKAMGDIHTS
jgi:hypothetical protein